MSGIRCDSGSWASPRVTPIGALGSAGHIEVAQGGVAQAVDAVEPGEHVLDHQLGLAIDIGGIEARVFLDGNRLGLAVDRSRGRKDQASWAAWPERLQAERAWRRCCCGNRGSGCRMDSPASMRAAKWRTASKGVPESVAETKRFSSLDRSAKISLDEFDTRGDLLAAAMAQIIEYNGIVAFGG